MKNRHSDTAPIDPPSLSGPTQTLLERHPAQPGSERAHDPCATPRLAPSPPASKNLARHGWIEIWAAQWYIPM
jgi:hypothetical protein